MSGDVRGDDGGDSDGTQADVFRKLADPLGFH